MSSGSSNFNEKQATLSVYNMQLRNIGRAKCIVCPTNRTVGRATALPA